MSWIHAHSKHVLSATHRGEASRTEYPLYTGTIPRYVVDRCCAQDPGDFRMPPGQEREGFRIILRYAIHESNLGTPSSCLLQRAAESAENLCGIAAPSPEEHMNRSLKGLDW